MEPAPEFKFITNAETLPEILPLPVAVRFAVFATMPPDMEMSPLLFNVNVLAVDAPRLTAPLSVRVTSLELLALNVLAFVVTVIVPTPVLKLKDGVVIFPEILPAPSALRLAKLVAVKDAPKLILPPEPVDVISVAEPVVRAALVLMLPAAVKAKILPDEAPKLTAPLSVNVTLPKVFAAIEPALV